MNEVELRDTWGTQSRSLVFGLLAALVASGLFLFGAFSVRGPLRLWDAGAAVLCLGAAALSASAIVRLRSRHRHV